MRPRRLHTTVQVAACMALLGACAVSFPEVGYQTVDDGAGGGAGGGSSIQASSSSRAASSSSASGSGGGAVGGGAPCSHASDCGPPPGACVEPACVDNVCTTSPSVAETPCISDHGNVCDGQGQCVGCLAGSDCPTVECQSATCGSDETCTYSPDDGGPCGMGLQCVNGSCTGCTMDDQCGMGTACQIPHCDMQIGACDLLPASAGTACTSADPTVKFCDGAGACSLQCRVGGDCGTPPPCKVFACAMGLCEAADAQQGSACAGGVCDGSGSCVACNVSADCPVCFTCDTTTHTCTAVAEDVQEPGVCDDTTGGCGQKCACTGAPADACKRKNGQICVVSSDCATGRCPPAQTRCGLPTGSSCTFANDCASTKCMGGVCQ